LQPAADFGGAERQATYLIAGLPRHGIEVIPLVGPSRPLVDELDRLGVRAIHSTGIPADEKAPRSARQKSALIERYVRAFFQMSHDVAEEAQRRRCVALAAPGRILLLHDHPRCGDQTARAVSPIIDRYRAMGFEFVALE
jgi:hypothetical protein